MTGESQNTAQRTGLAGGKIWWATRAAWICVFFGFVLAVPAVWRLFHEQGDRFTLANYSSLGSYLQGTAASFWALGGLLFIYATFLGQQQQIAQQDKELEAQKEQSQKQHQSIERQNFESSFFQLLNLQNQLIAAISTGGYTGRLCFQYWHNGYPGSFDDFLRRKGQMPSSPITTDFRTAALAVEWYEQFYNQHEANLAHYFRNLYHIFKFVKFSDVEPKRQYTSLVRAQLSKFELFFLFYNCLSRYGEKFKPLIEEFGLLEHLDKRLLLSPSHEKLYAESAYK